MKSILRHTRQLLIPLVIIGLLAAWYIAIHNKTQAPEISTTTLDGKPVDLASLTGQIVLVNFWATDCPGCIKEMPDLIQTYQDYHDKGFELLAVAMSYDPPSHVLNYAQKNALPFPVIHDSDGKIATDFNQVRVTPTAFILDKQGRVIRRVVGELDFNDLRKLLDAELAGESSQAQNT